MGSQQDGDRMVITNNHAGCLWLFYAVLLIPFFIAVPYLWLAPRDKAPLMFIVPFTLIFVLALPFVVRHILHLEYIRMTLDRRPRADSGGLIMIQTRGIFTRRNIVKPLDQIWRMEMEVSDNDGYFYSVDLAFRDGTKIALTQGSHKAGVLQECDNLREFLHRDIPELQMVERAAHR
ncbi:MAG: hypothetical protein U5J78_06805 [Parasphingorhabdus sp.]|nr:hypothetical protein [Parasphingorhabdus sp.]